MTALIDNRYRPARVLGVGGMSLVHEVEDMLATSLALPHRHWALKRLNADTCDYPDAQNLLLHEFILAQKLRHTHLLPINHFGIHDNTAYLVMPILQGDSLSYLLDTQIPLSWCERASLASQFIQALAHCHQQQVVHGDIKPGNIMVSPQGALTLFDYGISQSLVESENRFALNFEQVQAWSGRYAAPEVQEGQTPTLASDYYSAAKLLEHLLFHTQDEDELHQLQSTRLSKLLTKMQRPFAPRREFNPEQLLAFLSEPLAEAKRVFSWSTQAKKVDTHINI